MDEPFAPGELRARRRALGLSQAALATQLDVASNTVARWERGEARTLYAGRVRQLLDQFQGFLRRTRRHLRPRQSTICRGC